MRSPGSSENKVQFPGLVSAKTNDLSDENMDVESDYDDVSCVATLNHFNN